MTSGFHEVEYVILGAGIAGLSLADSLQEGGARVAVVEQKEVASGASGTPGGLVNPATGRRGTKVWRAEACYEAIKDSLEKVQEYSGKKFFRNNGVLRPALTQKMAGKMLEQFNKTSWPEHWCNWLDEQEIRDMHPGIKCVEGGLWLPVGLTVDVSKYLSALASYLKTRDVALFTGDRPDIIRDKSGWIVETSAGILHSQHLICATGFDTISSGFWEELPLHPVKGQVACFEADPRLLLFDHSISSLGYIARVNSSPVFIQGSTYEHDFEYPEPDESGETYLRKRLQRTLPDLAAGARLRFQWAGIRISTPNKKPITGRHKDIPNLHVFTGLGSKGLLFGKYLANHYTDHLLKGTPVSHEVSIARVYNS